MSDQAAAQQRQQASIAALERGGLPLAAQERIEELREGRTAWTSDLTVAEMAAIQHAGFEPVGMVMGSSVCRIAAHIGDTVRKTGKDRSDRELAMAMARKDLDWERQFETALYGDVAKRIHERDGDMETCSMCGDLCAVKMVKDLLAKEDKKK